MIFHNLNEYFDLVLINNIIVNMPQLVPFYFINEVFFTFVLIVGILYILSNYALPRIVRLFISRLFIKKINNI